MLLCIYLGLPILINATLKISFVIFTLKCFLRWLASFSYCAITVLLRHPLWTGGQAATQMSTRLGWERVFTKQTLVVSKTTLLLTNTNTKHS